MIPLLSFVAKSGSGKTTLIEKLVAELKRRGYRIAVVKHHAHTTPIDGRGKDSWRFAEAGASVAFVSSPVEIARFERVPRELTLRRDCQPDSGCRFDFDGRIQARSRAQNRSVACGIGHRLGWTSRRIDRRRLGSSDYARPAALRFGRCCRDRRLHRKEIPPLRHA